MRVKQNEIVVKNNIIYRGGQELPEDKKNKKVDKKDLTKGK